MEYTLARNAAEDLTKGLGRRGFMRAVAALGAGVGVAGVASGCAHSNASPAGSSSSALPFADGIPILQPGSGNVSGDHYLSSDPSDVMWGGYVPNIHTREVMRMKSGQTVTIDALSHEGILEDQGRNPLEYFGSKGVSEKDVLEDAIAVAAEYNRTERNFDKDGPHVVTGPVFVEGAQPGDVLKIETLEAIPPRAVRRCVEQTRQGRSRRHSRRNRSSGNHSGRSHAAGRHRRARNKGPVEVRRCFHFHGDRRRQGRDAFRTVEGAVSPAALHGNDGSCLFCGCRPDIPVVELHSSDPGRRKHRHQASRCRINLLFAGIR